MTDDEAVRVWLVERSYGSDEDLVTLVFATTDGRYQLKKQLSHNMLYGKTITAAREEPPENLDEVKDAETRERYASEASRMAEEHDPDEAV
ncbi:hypothetical protein GRX03_03075 [Halovenus sp. WSH3]|uniref:DUF7967 domain-containing protein n=1 Tax=Halovenus carboxidivorans TaxID=2692199 RepID=A0A6B0T5J0_9EURY|nr:hypothetical protein [Halovenus carboxidivorans]MXR50592.1 hypothetical protein [Halovenus carboxidivorans]